MAFIVFEGLDASGKSTLINKVRESLRNQNQVSLFLRDPGSTELGEKLRNIILATDIEAPVPRAETLLYQAARVQMVEKNILPALRNKEWVLCDRFYSSTVAFQSFARGLDLQDIEHLNHFVASDCEPDLFIFLDITVDESQRRKESRCLDLGVEQDRMEKEAIEFQEKVREGYLYQAKKKPEKWLILDGTLSPDELLTATLQEFKKRQWLV
jgi:dTMP kinase